MKLKKIKAASKNLVLVALLASLGTQAFAQDYPPYAQDEEFSQCPAVKDIQQDPSGDNSYFANVDGVTWSGKTKKGGLGVTWSEKTKKDALLGPIDSLRGVTVSLDTDDDFSKPFKLYCSYNTVNRGVLYLYYPSLITAKQDDFFKHPGWNVIVSCLSSQSKCEFRLPKSTVFSNHK